LEGYHGLGINSFNMTFYSSAWEERSGYSLNLKFISRPYPEPFYVSDCGFMEKLHSEVIVETKPESVAENLRRYFK